MNGLCNIVNGQIKSSFSCLPRIHPIGPFVEILVLPSGELMWDGRDSVYLLIGVLFHSMIYNIMSLIIAFVVAFLCLQVHSDLDSFIRFEKAIALQGALNNIGPNGSAVKGAGNYVVASPSKVNPDCK